MTIVRHILPTGAAVALALSACGGSDSTDDEPIDDSVVPTESVTESPEDFTPVESGDPVASEPSTSGPATDVSESAEAEDIDPATSAPAPETEAIEPTDGTDTGGVTGAIPASLVEWEVGAPIDYDAGEVTFTATNNGNFPHEFVVIQGDGYESLPLAEGGKVIEDELAPDALLGRTDRLSAGASEDLTVSLEPGNYVLLCNLGSGSNSHAGKGQVLDITVS